jgi:uncharacterized short protein YbdD (DUF466 family)
VKNWNTGLQENFKKLEQIYEKMSQKFNIAIEIPNQSQYFRSSMPKKPMPVQKTKKITQKPMPIHRFYKGLVF